MEGVHGGQGDQAGWGCWGWAGSQLGGISPSWITSPHCRVIHKTQPCRLQPIFSSLGAFGGGQQCEELAGLPQGYFGGTGQGGS